MVALAASDRDRLLLVPALRAWSGRALRGLARRRAEIDALNVYPVPDADTGTNLLLTVRDGCRALAAAGPGVTPQQAAAALDRGVLLGARGNSGVILSQLLHGALTSLAVREESTGAVSAAHLRPALGAAVRAAVAAVARPVDGTILSVAAAAADGAPDDPADWDSAVDAAVAAAAEALARTPTQLAVLAEAGVVDAGGAGLLVLLEALRREPALMAADGERAWPAAAAGAPRVFAPSAAGSEEVRFEVMYVVEAAPTRAQARDDAPAVDDASAVDDLRRRLDALGDSVLVVGGDGLWRVHVHTGEAGPAVEAAFLVGRPRDVRVTALAPRSRGPARPVGPASTLLAPAVPAPAAPAPAAPAPAAPAPAAPAPAPPAPAVPAPTAARRQVVAVLGERAGDGLVTLVEAAGGAAVRIAGIEPGELAREGAAEPGRGGAGGVGPLMSALSALPASDADEVVLLPADRRSLAAARAAAAAAREAPAGVRGQGVDVSGVPARVAVVPSAATVQVLAALAVHDPARPLADDLAAMAAAAAGTRHGGVTVAAREAMTSAGPCRAGDVLGVIGGDFVVIGADAFEVAAEVTDRLLQGGGELVTLVVCPAAPSGLAEAVTEHLRATRPDTDVSVHAGGPDGHVILVGVE